MMQFEKRKTERPGELVELKKLEMMNRKNSAIERQ